MRRRRAAAPRTCVAGLWWSTAGWRSPPRPRRSASASGEPSVRGVMPTCASAAVAARPAPCRALVWWRGPFFPVHAGRPASRGSGRLPRTGRRCRRLPHGSDRGALLALAAASPQARGRPPSGWQTAEGRHHVPARSLRLPQRPGESWPERLRAGRVTRRDRRALHNPAPTGKVPGPAGVSRAMGSSARPAFRGPPVDRHPRPRPQRPGDSRSLAGAHRRGRRLEVQGGSPPTATVRTGSSTSSGPVAAAHGGALKASAKIVSNPTTATSAPTHWRVGVGAWPLEFRVSCSTRRSVSIPHAFRKRRRPPSITARSTAATSSQPVRDITPRPVRAPRSAPPGPRRWPAVRHYARLSLATPPCWAPTTRRSLANWACGANPMLAQRFGCDAMTVSLRWGVRSLPTRGCSRPVIGGDATHLCKLDDYSRRVVDRPTRRPARPRR